MRRSGATAVPGVWVLMAWMGVISLLGVFLAVPAKRQMINVEQLRFPSGIAAATTLRTLHHEGGGAAARQARSLGLAVLFGTIVTWCRDATAGWMKVTPWGFSCFRGGAASTAAGTSGTAT